MDNDKIKQFVAMVGGFLGALYLALQSVGIELHWFNTESINAWMAVLTTAIPLGLVFYGIYKNQYILTEKARKAEEVLKDEGIK